MLEERRLIGPTNRKGHYQRALEEAVQTHNSQWPHAWEGKNPLHGGRTFTTMNPEERVWPPTEYIYATSLIMLVTSAQSSHLMVPFLLRCDTSEDQGFLQAGTTR